MNFRSVFLAAVGALVAVFYAVECFLHFQNNGVDAPLFAKLLLCGAGVYVFWRNARRIRNDGRGGPRDAR